MRASGAALQAVGQTSSLPVSLKRSELEAVRQLVFKSKVERGVVYNYSEINKYAYCIVLQNYVHILRLSSVCENIKGSLLNQVVFIFKSTFHQTSRPLIC